MAICISRGALYRAPVFAGSFQGAQAISRGVSFRCRNSRRFKPSGSPALVFYSLVNFASRNRRHAAAYSRTDRKYRYLASIPGVSREKSRQPFPGPPSNLPREFPSDNGSIIARNVLLVTSQLSRTIISSGPFEYPAPGVLILDRR